MWILNNMKQVIEKKGIIISGTMKEKCGNLVPNINLDLSQNQKRVLLVYLDYYEASQQVTRFQERRNSGALHTNRREFFQIIQSLIRMNLCIDVCAHDDVKAITYIKKQKYDYAIGLGKVFDWVIENKNVYKVLYMTENPYYISYKREKERMDYFWVRHHKRKKLVRTGRFFGKEIEKKVDAIVCLGDDKYYDIEKKVERINPSAFYNEKFNIEEINRKKNYFLVFGTDGFIHKGIDLLIDVFSNHPEWELFLCGCQITSTIKKSMNINITNTNIHDCGYIMVDSISFLNLVKICQFILLPSCSEATSTAVLTGMRHGLIPVVMHGNGFDKFESMCLFWENYYLKDIENILLKITKMESKELREKELKIYAFANREFSIEEFTCSFQNAIEKILPN